MHTFGESRTAHQIVGEHGVQIMMNPGSGVLKFPLYFFPFYEGVNTPIIMFIVLSTSNLAACRQGQRKKMTNV